MDIADFTDHCGAKQTRYCKPQQIHLSEAWTGWLLKTNQTKSQNTPPSYCLSLRRLFTPYINQPSLFKMCFKLCSMLPLWEQFCKRQPVGSRAINSGAERGEECSPCPPARAGSRKAIAFKVCVWKKTTWIGHNCGTWGWLPDLFDI